MELALEKSEYIEDWYSIIRAEHDNNEWFHQTYPYSYQLMMSKRLSPEADIEGTSSDMLMLADAISNREERRFTRCAVRFDDCWAYFWSPKNSQEDGIVTHQEADKLAALITIILKVD